MDKPVLKNSLKLFDSFGKIKSRSMFGGFGIFCEDAMFALVVKDKLHIRASDNTSSQFSELGCQPYIYKKRGFPVVTKYFALPEELWQQPEQILAFAQVALEHAQQAKAATSQEKPCRIKDLPNLRLANERMLKKVGIESVSDLKKAGALGAYQAMQQMHADKLNIELLWALEGALNGTHWSVVSQERRQELLNSLQ